VIDFLIPKLGIWAPLLLSMTVHEWAHARAAYALGDDTAESMGRMTLAPFVHIDPIGTLLLPLLGIPIGWAKPVPVRPERFRSDVSMPVGMALVAAAGPISNLCLATLLLPLSMLLPLGVFHDALVFAGRLNLALAVFNLLPIPPLDGSRLVSGMLSRARRERWDQLGIWGPVVLAPVAIGLWLVWTVFQARG